MSRLGTNADISDNLDKLKKSNSKLDRMLAKIGSKADNQDFRAGLLKERNAAKRTCKNLMRLVKQAQGSDMMKMFSDSLRTELDKFKTVSLALEDREREVVIAISSSKADPSHHMEDNQSRQQQAQQLDVDIQFLDYDVEEIKRREEGIRNIEQDVKEVAEMFNDLGLLVNEQQETLDLIENNISGAKNKTAGAADQLKQAESLQKKSRKKNCCLLFIVLVVLAAAVLGILANR